MEITVNGKKEDLPGPMALEDFLKGKGLEEQGIVLELNREIVKREAWPTITIRGNDTLEILRFIGGGEATWRTV